MWTGRTKNTNTQNKATLAKKRTMRTNNKREGVSVWYMSIAEITPAQDAGEVKIRLLVRVSSVSELEFGCNVKRLRERIAED